MSENVVSLRCHWLGVTCWMPVDWVTFSIERSLPALLKGGAWEEKGGGLGYRSSYVGLGCRVYHNDTDELLSGEGHCHVAISGEGLDGLDFASVLSWLEDLSNDGRLRLSRIDIACDGLPVKPKRVYRELKDAGWGVTYYESSGTLRDGSTVYIGSAKSERRVRVYDARGYTRIETQCRGDVAASIGDMLLSGADASALFVSVARGEGQGRASWLRLFPECLELIGSSGIDWRVQRGTALGSREKVKDWMARQCIPTVRALLEVDPIWFWATVHETSPSSSVLALWRDEERVDEELDKRIARRLHQLSAWGAAGT